MTSRRGGVVFGLVCSLIAVTLPAGAQPATAERWVGTWATATVSAPSEPPSQPPVGLPAPPLRFNNQTVRQFARISIGGARLRVVLTNTFGTRALTIGGAHLALRASGAAIAPGSDRALTFGGLPIATIPPGAILVSDPVDLSAPDASDVAVDLFFPNDTGASPSPLTVHAASRQTNYVSAPGNHLGAAELPGATAIPAWAFLARLEVVAPERAGAVVAFGDSITDGFNSTPDTNNRWPDHLAKRLASTGSRMGVLNLGIDGNRVLADGAGISALARFDREVLAQPGVTHVFILEGINDLGIGAVFMDGPRPSTEELIAGHRQLIARAHAKGLKIFASTLLPYEGTSFPGYFTPEGETIREAFNRWLRTSKEYDGIVDFDAVMRDPAQPSKMLQKFDSGDHLHPNDAGYKAMADAVDLALFGVSTAGAAVR
jgi:lysophospholipase L1-like esterase